MKKIILSLLIFISVIGAAKADEVKINGNIGVVSNYVLFGSTQNDNRDSIQGVVNANYNGFFASIYANTLRKDNDNTLQTWNKIGYTYKPTNYSYITVDYNKDYYFNKNKYNGDYGEAMFGTKILDIISIDFYNLYNIETEKFIVHSGSIGTKVYDKVYTSFTIGTVTHNNYYYELLYSYSVADKVSIYAKGVHTDHINSDKVDEFLLFGINLNF